jgi:hypothetical protein
MNSRPNNVSDQKPRRVASLQNNQGTDISTPAVATIKERQSMMVVSSLSTQPLSQPSNPTALDQGAKIFDDACITAGYDSVPLIEIDTLPRGGISFETRAVGRIQVRTLGLVVRDEGDGL